MGLLATTDKTIQAIYDALAGLPFNPRDYGATPDGVTDSTAGIQAAINAASAAGGGTVILDPGTWLTGNLVLPSKVHLQGSGIEATILSLKAGTNNDVITGQNFATLSGTSSSGGIFNWSVKDLTIDGNKAANAFGFGLRTFGYGYILANLRVRNCAQSGIWSEWGSSAGSPGQDSMEAQLVNIKVHDCFHLVEWLGPHDSQWVNGVLYNAGGKGLYVRGNGGALQVENLHTWNTADTGVHAEAQILATGCEAEGAQGAAGTPNVALLANDCVWVGGVIFASGTSKIGVTVGDGTHAVAGTKLDTKILNCTSGAISLGQDTGGDYRVLAYNCGSPPYTGTPASGTRLRIVIPLGTGFNQGPLTSPAVPASTVPVTNTFGVDATVYVAGGTVSAIAVGGTATGLVSGAVRVPAGQTITLTYTAAPTWKWFGE